MLADVVVVVVVFFVSHADVRASVLAALSHSRAEREAGGGERRSGVLWFHKLHLLRLSS